MNLRKIMVVLLSTIVMITSVNLAAVGEAFAAEVSNTKAVIVESGQCGNKVNWTLDSEGTLTLSGKGETYTFTFDSTNGIVYRTVNGERVSNPLASNDKIKKIVVEKGITKVQNYGFYDCKNLTEVQLPEGLQTIGRGLFRKCTALEEIQLPSTVTVIGDNAFYDATALKRIEIPENVPDLRSEMFRNCTSLEEIILPEGMTSIGNHAFRNCDSLKQITLPEGLTSLGQCAFGECDVLESIKIPEGITALKQDMFWRCKSLTKVELPDTMTEFGDYVFQECEALESIDIPAGVTTWGKQAFQRCRRLKSVKIPEGVEKLRAQTFYECTQLREVQIPDTVKEIGDYVFSECDALEYLYLPDSIEEIGDYLCFGDGQLKEVKLPKDIKKISAYAFALCENLQKADIPSGVTKVSNHAFWQCISLKEIVIPEGVTYIGKTAFRECRYLEELTLPSTLEEIDEFAFFNCHKLKELNLPEGLLVIGEQAFYGLSDITEVTIPKGVTSIEQYTFRGCKRLEHVIFTGDVTKLGAGAFTDCAALVSISLPQTLTTIGEGAFEKCVALKSITVPSGVKKLERYAFQDCSKLQSVTLQEGLAEISAYVFAGCEQLKSLVVPKTTRTFGTNAVPNEIKMFCYKGSAAEIFAKDEGRRYAYVGDGEADNLVTGSINTAETQAEWTIDRKNDTMKMTWNGKMPKYTASTQPWKNYRLYIGTVEIFGNVNKLENYTFSKCENLKQLTIYNRNCDMSGLELPKGVTIYGFKDSMAEAYAKKKGYTFVSLDASHSHTFNEGVETKAATCYMQGEMSYTCTVCQYEKKETLGFKDHQYQVQIQPADMNQDGLLQNTCSVCGNIKDEQIIPKTGEISLSWDNCVYTGGTIDAPALTVKDINGKSLTAGTDYTVSGLENKTAPGRYPVTVTFTGSYSGSKVLYFTIMPKRTASAKAVLYGYDDVKFSWSKAEGATGYLVSYKKGNGAWSEEVSTTATSYKKANLADGVKYTFRVVPYYSETKAGERYFDVEQYKTATTYTLKKVSGVKVVKSGSKVKVSWTNINGETGYQISKMTKKSATQKKPLTVKSSTAKYKKVTAAKKKTYYYKVRAYKTVNGKNVYGPWSVVKAFKR